MTGFQSGKRWRRGVADGLSATAGKLTKALEPPKSETFAFSPTTPVVEKSIERVFAEAGSADKSAGKSRSGMLANARTLNHCKPSLEELLGSETEIPSEDVAVERFGLTMSTSVIVPAAAGIVADARTKAIAGKRRALKMDSEIWLRRRSTSTLTGHLALHLTGQPRKSEPRHARFARCPKLPSPMRTRAEGE